MNVYFWCFAVYALLITPVSMQIHIRAERGIHYRIRLRMAGFPMVRKIKQENRQEEVHLQPGTMMKGMRGWDGSLIANLIHQGYLKKLIRLFQWHDIQINVCISFDDAAQTAIIYALICAFAQTIARIRPLNVKGGVKMDFQGRGSALSFRGIAHARLGKLMAAAIRIWLAVGRHNRMKMEEEKYAAASH